MPSSLFDLKHWISVFPLEQERRDVYARVGEFADRYIGGRAVTSPHSIAINEQIRGEVLQKYDLGPATPVDIFVFGLGEPTDPVSTKIGGLPYWPRDRAWPQTEQGEPMTFIAQLCFADSLDHCLPVPAKLLLIFASDEHLSCDPEFAFEWVDPDRPSELATAAEIPAPTWEFPTCYTERHRTVDYGTPVAIDALDAALHPKACKPELACLEGTKIGGVPRWIQWWDPDDNELPTGARFLATLGTIFPAAEVPYPWLNHPAPFWLRDFGPGWPCPTLMFDDSSCLYLFLNPDNSISWVIQGY